MAALLCLAGHVFAHEHHMDDIPEGEAVSAEPIVYPAVPGQIGRQADTMLQDAILWIHILIQIFSFGIVFPTGMVLGVRSLPSAVPQSQD